MSSWRDYAFFEYLRPPPAPYVAPLCGEDATAVAAIHGDAFAHGWDVLEFQALIADRAVLADGLFVGRARRLVGIALSRTVLDEAEILTVALARSARRRGWSRLLLGPHLDALALKGIRTVFLEVEEDNLAAIRLYERAGFRAFGRREAYYRRPDGAAAAAVTMRFALAGEGKVA